MQVFERLNEAIHYIEEHLDQDISYEEIDKITLCSIYNFQRIFTYMADMTLSEYIRNRRLTLAAFDLINSSEQIIEIALKYGYTSHDAFTRAFQKFHGVLPSKVRTQTTSLKSCPKISFQINIKGDYVMNYRIETSPAFTISGFKKSIKTELSSQIIPRIWEQANHDGTMSQLFELLSQDNLKPSGLLGVSCCGQWGKSEHMDYYLGVTTHQENNIEINIPSHLDKIMLPEATWVIFEANGPLPEAVQMIYKKFYTEWLPSSGYELDDLPVIECYFPNQKQEVWIAIM